MSANPAKPVVTPTLRPAGRERRRSERRPFIVETWLRTGEDSDDRIEINTLDISHHGIGFELDQNVKTGSFFQMEMSFGPQILSAEVRIVSCHEAEKGVFHVGAEFC